MIYGKGLDIDYCWWSSSLSTNIAHLKLRNIGANNLLARGCLLALRATIKVGGGGGGGRLRVVVHLVAAIESTVGGGGGVRGDRGGGAVHSLAALVLLICAQKDRCQRVQHSA